MCCTCSLSAPPRPTMACLMSLGAYSCTASPACTTAQIAAPLACPSLIADCGLRLMKTLSMATASGRNSAMASVTPAKMPASLSGISPPPRLSWRAATNDSPSMMPMPVMREPGSRPRIRISGGSSPVRGQSLVSLGWNIGVVPDVLCVVDIFEHVEEFQQFLAGFHVLFNQRRRAHRDLGLIGLQAGIAQHAQHAGKFFRGRQHLDAAVVVGLDVFGARFQRGFHHLVFAGAGCERDYALLFKQVGHRALGAQVAAVLGECMSDCRDGAVTVVGDGLDHHRHAAGRVALVGDFLVIDAFELAS